MVSIFSWAKDSKAFTFLMYIKHSILSKCNTILYKTSILNAKHIKIILNDTKIRISRTPILANFSTRYKLQLKKVMQKL